MKFLVSCFKKIKLFCFDNIFFSSQSFSSLPAFWPLSPAKDMEEAMEGEEEAVTVVVAMAVVEVVVERAVTHLSRILHQDRVCFRNGIGVLNY